MIIGITGAAGAGKDTIAKILVDDYPNFVVYKMAGPLKTGLSAMLNIPMEDIENPSLKNQPNYKFDRSIRYMLQTLGTEWGRDLIHPDLWVELAKENINREFMSGNNVVISDLRFENEAKAIVDMDGFIINVIRTDNIELENTKQNGVANHPSEGGVPHCFIDYNIVNNGSINDLKRALKVPLQLFNISCHGMVRC